MRIAVTGAFGYTGRAVARQALARGDEVVTLTNRPAAGDPLAAHIAVRPLAFDRPALLVDALRDVDALVDTYWVRFDRGSVGFDRAVVESTVLAQAAGAAGVGRLVHIGVTKADPHSPLPYFRGKGRIDRMLLESDLSLAIVRPTLVFGQGDVLVNNIAWLLRRLPLFGIPGRGDYPVQPIHVDDVARIVLDAAGSRERLLVDAVGPETFAYRDLVRLIRDAVGSPAAIVAMPPALVAAAATIAGLALGDVVLTRDEIGALTAGLLASDEAPAGEVRFGDWLTANADGVGRRWANELRRHFGKRAPVPAHAPARG